MEWLPRTSVTWQLGGTLKIKTLPPCPGTQQDSWCSYNSIFQFNEIKYWWSNEIIIVINASQSYLHHMTSKGGDTECILVNIEFYYSPFSGQLRLISDLSMTFNTVEWLKLKFSRSGISCEEISKCEPKFCSISARRCADLCLCAPDPGQVNDVYLRSCPQTSHPAQPLNLIKCGKFLSKNGPMFLFWN